MVHNGGLNSAEANEAAWEAGKGAVTGAARWGIGAAILSGAGYAMSPIYRGLTIQFKVSSDVCSGLTFQGMIMGACLEADSRIRAYEAKVRMEKRLIRDRALWKKYEMDYEKPPEQDNSQ